MFCIRCLLWFPFDMLAKWQQSRNETWTELVGMWWTDASKIRKEIHNRSIINCNTFYDIENFFTVYMCNRIITMHLLIHNVTCIAILTLGSCDMPAMQMELRHKKRLHIFFPPP